MSEIEALRNELTEQMDRFGASSAATTTALLFVVELLASELARHRLLDSSFVRKKLKEKASVQGAHPNTVGFLMEIESVLRDIAEENEGRQQ
jgi:hypothetical protein